MLFRTASACSLIPMSELDRFDYARAGARGPKEPEEKCARQSTYMPYMSASSQGPPSSIPGAG